jgi:NAD(P)-dependent dehydrogenase (short-subunit alcohol dehydrogenase family)
MDQRVCVVTGATGGIGLETAHGIALQGATVVIVGRSPDRSRVAVEQVRRQTGNPNVGFAVADLSLQGDIRRLAGELQERYPCI